MFFRIAADIVLVAHLAFIVYVTLGGLLNVRWRRAWIVHIPAILWGFLIEFLGYDCPLTTLENYFRSGAGELGYERGFLDHFISTLIYPDIPPFVHIFLGVLLAAVNGFIYWYLFRRNAFADPAG
jgi:hypothetical protein